LTKTSSDEAVARFDTQAAAEKYARALPGTGTDRRERRCLTRALAGVRVGAEVLDLPCGTGRLLPLLCGLGYKVTGADSSAHMVEQARQYAALQGLPLGADRFFVANILRTPFGDAAFDAVVCNRLFHHFRESEVRRAALRELRRLSKGPIVVSFFRNLGWGAFTFHLKRWLSRSEPKDRIPIRLATFQADIEAAGLRLVRTWAVRPLVTKNWYVLLVRA